MNLEELKVVALFRCGRYAMLAALLLGVWLWPNQTERVVMGLIDEKAAQITKRLTDGLEPVLQEGPTGGNRQRSSPGMDADD